MTKTFAIAIAVAMLLAASLAATPDSKAIRPDLRLAQGSDIQIGPDRDGGYRRGRSDADATVSIGHGGVTAGPRQREGSRVVRITIEQPIAEPGFPSVVGEKTRVGRSRKGDRLIVNDGGGALNTTIVPKTVLVPDHSVQRANTTSACPETLQIDEKKHVPKLEPAPLIDCEGPASSASVPTWSRSISRCYT